MQNRSFSRAHALARLSPAAALAASAVLGMGLVMGCNAPVSPSFELHLDGNTSCNAAALEDVRLMCDSTVRVRMLDADGSYDLVPPVCQDLDSVKFGTLQALEELRVEFEALPLGSARFQLEIWPAGVLGPAECGGEPDGEYDELAQRALSSGPAVIGQAQFEIGDDAHVLVPLECPDLGQVNRFAPGCSLDVEIGDLDRGTKLRRPGRNVEREDPATIDEDDVQGNTESDSQDIDLDHLEVLYGFADSDDTNGWEFVGVGNLDLHDHSDGSVVWRYRPNDYFWKDQLPTHETLCIQVTRGEGETPQLSCIGAEIGSPSARVQASYLPPEDLACLLAANGASSVPEEGIVMGRVVQPATENAPPNMVEVELPAANVQVFPTAADDLPQMPDPLLKVAASGEVGGEDAQDGTAGENVQYVSKDPDAPSRTTSACRVDDTSATTSSGYFLSDASFPAHWEVETGTLLNEAQDSLQGAATGDIPARPLVGGRIPGTVSIVRIPLR